jgi:hypothetical protein
MISLVNGLHKRHRWRVAFGLVSVVHEFIVAFYKVERRKRLVVENTGESVIGLPERLIVAGEEEEIEDDTGQHDGIGAHHIEVDASVAGDGGLLLAICWLVGDMLLFLLFGDEAELFRFEVFDVGDIHYREKVGEVFMVYVLVVFELLVQLGEVFAVSVLFVGTNLRQQSVYLFNLCLHLPHHRNCHQEKQHGRCQIDQRNQQQLV